MTKENKIFKNKPSDYFLKIIVSPVPDNIFLFDNTSIISPFLTWSMALIASLGSACVTCVVGNGQQTCQINRCFLSVTSTHPDPPALFCCMLVNFSGMENKTKNTCLIFISWWRWKKARKKFRSVIKDYETLTVYS